MTSLKLSHIDTIEYINGRQGTTVSVIGADYAKVLVEAGLITVKNGKCYSTQQALSQYRTPSKEHVRASRAHARATLIGKWGAMDRPARSG